MSREREDCNAALETGEKTHFQLPQTGLTINAEKRKNEILLSDLENRVRELGREKHHSERYENQLNEQAAAHKDLVELLKKSQRGMIAELTKEDGILAAILSSGSAAQTK